MDNLRKNYNLYLDQSKNTLSCLNNQIPDDLLEKITVDCPVVDIEIDKRYYLFSYKVSPHCVEKKNLFPTNRLQLESCIENVKNYLEHMNNSIASASWELRQQVDDAADKAVRKFNCYAKGEINCY